MNRSFNFFDKSGRIVGHGIITGDNSDLIYLEVDKIGFKIYLENAESNQPLIAHRGKKMWKNSTATTSGTSQKKVGWFGEIVASFHDTKTASLMGEKPKYLIEESQVSGAYLWIGTHNGMKVMALKAYDMPFLLRRGSFLLSQEGVKLSIQVIDIPGKNSRQIADLLGFQYFQKISGYGTFLIESHGNAEVIELFPGEEFHDDPRRIIGMTETVRIIDVWKVSAEAKVRSAEGTDYNITLKANSLGGIIILAAHRQEPPKKPEK